MRSCDEILELMSAALDGELTGEEQAALEEHLSHCSACRALFADLLDLQSVSSSLEDAPAPEGFADGVMAHIAADPTQEQPDSIIPFPTPKPTRSHWKSWTASAAVIAVVVLGAVFLPGQWGADTDSTGNADAPSLANAADTATNGDSSAEGTEVTTNDNAGNDAAMPELGNSLENGNAACDEAQPKTFAEDNISFFAASAPTYCGAILLTGEPLPEGLEEYSATQDAQGNLTYIVPADYYFSAVEALEAVQASNYTDVSEQENIDPAAEYGLIIVEVP